MKKVLLLLAQLFVARGQVAILPYKESGFEIGQAYDPRHESCCGIKTYSNANRHRFLKCCGNNQYDVTEQVCCNITVHSLRFGFGCCGDAYFNLTSNYCCPDGEAVLLRTIELADSLLSEVGIGKYLNCCCDASYDIRTQLCCDCNVLDKTESNYSCCGTSSYTPSPTLVCCNGSVIRLPDHANYACCGNASYNVHTHFCCGIRVHAKNHKRGYAGYGRYNNRDGCCGDERFDSWRTLCCEDNDGKKIVVTPPGYSAILYDCCGTTHFHIISDLCCDVNGSKVVTRKQQHDHTACCGNATFDSGKSHCCADTMVDKAGASYDDNLCCGPYPYVNRSQICCYDEEMSLYRMYKNSCGTHCCGIAPYFPEKEACVNKQVLQVSPNFGSCNGQRYKKDEEICCDGIVVEKAVPKLNYTCCGSYGYEVGKAICCHGLEVRPISHPGQNSCCVVPKGNRDDW